ncbi:tetratricopeptide repeat protein, partial [Duganella sp. FT94W]
ADAADAADAGAPGGRQEELYREAVRALEEGRAEEASRLLLRFLEGEPQHAGAWLDLAISECQLGRAVEAERLFQQIQERFVPPPGIVEIITAQRASGCQRPAVRGMFMLSLARGYDSNVNQGAASSNFQTGSGDNELHWELGPEFLPKADRYTQLVADYSQPLSQGGLFGFAQLRARRNDSVHSQDLMSLLAGLEQPWQWGRWRARGTLALSALQLDGQYYQRQTQLQIRVTPPLPLPEAMELSLSSGLSHVNYPTRTKYDGNTLELGAMLRYDARATLMQASLGALTDKGQSGRLGGDRTGTYGTVLVDTRWSDRFSTQLVASRQVWRSAAVYSENVIDIKRHQDTRQLSASATWQLQPHHSVQLEARAVRNQENIGLFQYNSRMLQLSYRWDNF